MPDTASITPSLAGQVWLKSIRFPFLNQVVTVSDYSDVVRPSRVGAFPVTGRAVPVATLDLRGTREYMLLIRTETEDAKRTLALSLIAGEAILLHVPTTTGNALLPGSMYAVVGDVTKHRVGGISPHHLFQLPLTEVAPPGPDVIGGTMTYGALLNQFAGLDNILAAHSAYTELLDLMASPEDIVVV